MGGIDGGRDAVGLGESGRVDPVFLFVFGVVFDFCYVSFQRSRVLCVQVLAVL